MIKKFHLFLLPLIFCSLLASTAIAFEEYISDVFENFRDKTQDQNLVFLFPVNVYDAKIKLEVDIPKNLKSVKQEAGSQILEFIPSTDTDSNKWSEILTLSPIIGESMQASDFIEIMINGMSAASKDAKVLEKSGKKYDKYQDATAIIQYKTPARQEIAIFYSVSGPYDIASVQYAQPLSSTKKEDVDAAVGRLKDFIAKNTKVRQT